MRTPAFALLLAASASAQAVNTQVDGLVLTNGLSSLSDSSAINSGANASFGITYLTDNDALTLTTNIGEASGSALSNGGSIQGGFAGNVSSDATGVLIVGSALSAFFNNHVPTTLNGSFALQLVLNSGLSSSQTYSDANFTITSQLMPTIDSYSNFNDYRATTQYTPTSNVRYYYSYLFIPFADFGTTFDQVVGIKIGDTTSQFPDFSYIGVGYLGTYSGGGGTPAVPEASTYGLILGGLALVGAVIRRRRSKQA